MATKVFWKRRYTAPLSFLLLVSVVIGYTFSPSGNLYYILDSMKSVLTAPVLNLSQIPRSHGPPKALLYLFFCVLPVILLPAYAMKPKRFTYGLTIAGAVLWGASGFIFLALRYAD
jgi:hypothetical protein